MSDLLIFDLSNVSYIGAYSLGRGAEQHPAAPEQICQATTDLMRQIYRWFQPKQVLFACDHSEYWRRQMFPDYKAHRPHNLLKQQVRAGIKLFKERNAQLCVEVPYCEADDVIYAASQWDAYETKAIVSSDMDFLQLMSEQVKVFDPKHKQFRPKLKKPEYELFLKCMRGDSSDNIPSAYPYVRTKILQAAYHDPTKWQALMDTELKDGTVVENNYERNCNLIDLSRIPELHIEAMHHTLTQFFAIQKEAVCE